MNTNTIGIVVQGQVRPDGTLELDERLRLPAGRVQVTVQSVVETAPLPEEPREDWFQYLQRARAELEASGTAFRTAEEIEAEREDFRSGDERLEELHKELDSQGGRLE